MKQASQTQFSSALLQSLFRWAIAIVLALACLSLTAKLMTELITPSKIEQKIYHFLSVDFVRISPSLAQNQEQEDVAQPELSEPEAPPPQIENQAPYAPALQALPIEAQDLNAVSLPLTLSPPTFSANSIVRPVETKPEFNEQLFPLLTPSPNYPRRAKRARIEGWVNIEFTIQVDGKVSDVKVISAEPEGIFESTTLRAVNTWKFKPQMLAGKPTARRVVQTIHFTLED